MANYQPDVLRKFASRLYTAAKLLMILIGAFFGLLGLIMGSVAGIVTGSTAGAIVLAFLGLVFGGATGVVIGWLIGYLCKLKAQMILCNVEIELNSRRDPVESEPAPKAKPEPAPPPPAKAEAPRPRVERPTAKHRVPAADLNKATARVPEFKAGAAAVAVADPDATPIAPPRFDPTKEIKVRCQSCGKRFAGTAESIGALTACPRCKATPFDVEAV